MYAFGAMLSFTIAHLSVIRLRLKLPGRRAALPRARATLRVARRASCRCSRSLGGLGTGIAFVTVTALHLDVAVAGIGWLLVGDRRLRRSTAAARGSTSTTTTKVAIPKPVVDHEAEYESVLVAFDERELRARRARHRGRSWRPAAAAGSTCS